MAPETSQIPGATGDFMQKNYRLYRHHVASRRVFRAVNLVFRAGRHLEDASRFAADNYNSDHLRYLAAGLRELSLPLSRIASHLQDGGAL